MYLPNEFRGDEALGWELAAEEAFGLLLAGDDVAPLPFVVDRERRALRAHLARASRTLRDRDGASVVFFGPHGYVTPRWYAAPREQVPTWNYVIVRMQGAVAPLSREGTARVLEELCARFEPPGGYDPSWIDPALHDQLLDAITGIEIAVERVEVKLKLSQNRDPEDRRRVRDGFAATHPALAAWMDRVAR
ncbi:MAG TPA: FMN-binding negative transcriptional regulator [Sandaracinaceae bacterium]